MQLRYSFRLYPTPGQQSALAKAFGCARVVFNDGLRARQEARKAGLPYIKVAPPRYRSRKASRQAIRLTRNGFLIRPDGRLYVAKIGDIEVRWSRALPSPPSSVTVIRDASGRYHASFVVQCPGTPASPVDAEIGIDLGLASFAVCSDGTVIDNPRLLRRAERRLVKAQKALSRKAKGSRNRAKARVRVSKIHARVADLRRDHAHQLSTRLIRENQAVYVEDLCVTGLARTRLAKSVYDAGWSQFLRMLEYKAARHGRYFARVGRFTPTSQTCSSCGVKDGPKPLRVREWTCGNCGSTHDRDMNAAKNILAAGRADRLNACGAPIRPGHGPARRYEAGTHRSIA
ncbi:transposase [Actinocorallia sp. API 0066]|uniref:RNA-guided endonuclease InsQ/TnpB family protein n=1 Tax=Actinocorallia sp. API 0066 TaxID=2896846 RepID=UPI001E5B2C3A|nr:transposase [Actinocorallia sp. API 0066]MCD0453155.1 transposase [Actinocorallia sp. API 0066]